MAAALALQSSLADILRAPITVMVDHARFGVAAALSVDDVALPIQPFGVVDAAVSLARLAGITRLERLARAFYLHQLHVAQGRGIEPTELMRVPWEDLPAAVREGNLRAAARIRNFLREFGLGLASISLVRHDEKQLVAPSAFEVEQLAIREHELMARDLMADGWRVTAGDEDAARRLHPGLVPWDQLPENSREAVRATIRERFELLPALLAHVGLRLIPVDDLSGPSPSPSIAASEDLA
jgi:hypothetical protein